MALVREAAGKPDGGERHVRPEEKVFGGLDPTPEEPTVRRGAGALLESAREVPARQPTLPGQRCQRDVPVEMSSQYFLGSAQLPRSEPTPRRTVSHRHSAIGAGDIGTKSQRYVVEI